MLNEKQLTHTQEELAKSIARRDLLSQEHTELRKNIAGNDKKINTLKDESEALQKESHELTRKTVDIATEHNQLQRLISDFEKALDEHKRDKAIEEMIAQQPEFYTVMKKRLTRLQEEISDAGNDFISFVAPENVIKAIKPIMEGNGFSQPLGVLRGGKQHYDSYIKNICTRRVDGDNISLNETQANLIAIDKWLMLPEVIRYWQK